MKSFCVQDIKIDKPILLAPMCGVTDYPFRKLVASFGCQVTFSEMIASAGMIRNLSKSLSKLKKIENTVNAIQIVGNDKYAISESVKIITDMGFDLIDINFGCPVKKIINNMCGSALLKDLKEFESIIDSAVKSTKIPVTIKTRLGWDSVDIVNISKIAENAGAKMITVHCRTRSQMFSGVANWSMISELKNNISIPYIVNGDIQTSKNLTDALSISNANGAMIGRGVYGKPWLIGQMISDLKNEIFNYKIDKNQIVKSHIHSIFSHYEDSKVANNFAKKHIFFYSKYSPSGKKLRECVSKVNSEKEMFQLINDFQF